MSPRPHLPSASPPSPLLPEHIALDGHHRWGSGPTTPLRPNQHLEMVHPLSPAGAWGTPGSCYWRATKLCGRGFGWTLPPPPAGGLHWPTLHFTGLGQLSRGPDTSLHLSLTLGIVAHPTLGSK